MGNSVVRFEVGAADDRLLVTFYGELFGWGLRGSSWGDYTMIDTRGGGGINGGIGKSQTGQPYATFFVETDDLQATLDKADSLGGTTVVPVTDRGGAMTIAMFNDPDGLLVGLVQATAEPAQGDEPAPSAGSGEPVDWWEVVGSDAARTQQFYADLFGWTVGNSAFPGYAVVDPDTGRGIWGGIGGLEEARLATVYVSVADVEQTLSRVEKLGGSRISAPRLSALKSAARAALYGAEAVANDDMETSAFRDPAGNLFGIYHHSR